MNYSRIQKWLSSFLIFSILFLQTFEVPLLSTTRAEAKVNADIVSFIVDEDIYGGGVKSKILQYAKDIQAYLPNTRVVIFPVQKTANPFLIASINEKLFYEGDGEGFSRLVGTILIGAVPLPVVHKEGKAFMSVYPYVDFEAKSFIYDQSKKSYEYLGKTLTNEKPEIWHSVIQPNTGDASKNKDELITFLNKTHDFYNKQGLFSSENTPTEPRVFYMDAFHDQKTSSPDLWKSYNMYLENIEDITYRRFNKYLAKKLYDASQDFYRLNSNNIQDPSIKTILDTYSGSTMDISKSPDITTKDIIEKSVKQFFEVFNAKYMGDVLRYVHNTGRYGDANKVRVDSTPVIIAKKDLFMRTTLKDINTSLEGAIDTLVNATLAESIKVATTYSVRTTTYSGGGIDENGDSIFSSSSTNNVYKNYFFGQGATLMNDPKQCTIVRGSTLKVEANRGYNIKNAQVDANFLSSDLGRGQCFPNSKPATISYWGGNSPLNFNTEGMKKGQVVLGTHQYTDFVKPIYDLAGSQELTPDSSLHIATPMDCLVNNMLFQPYIETITDSRYGTSITNSWPPEKNGSDFSCITTHQPLPFVLQDYYTYSRNLPSEPCTISRLKLDDKIVKESGSYCTVTKGSVNIEKIYNFKTLTTSKAIEHKSPTDEEYGLQLGNMITPSLPSDRDRYVDYLDKNITYQKIVYPNFFRITLDRTDLNYPGTQKKIKELLDAKSTEIKALGSTIDLYKILSADDKVLSAAIESVLWNNMKNATLKYSSTLERSLNIDGEKKISADDKKNNYEIAYLGAPGDAQNMYLKVDPEAKGPVPKDVSDIMNQVNNYHNLMDGSNTSDVSGNKADFGTCGPPEGVPIWEWLPAVFCWLGIILPPTISGGSCGGPATSGSEKTKSTFATSANALDANKNGILDGYELIGSGDLKLRSPDKIFGYGETVPLVAELTKDGKIIDIDSFNVVSFNIKKLSVYTPENTIVPKLIYDQSGSDSIADIRNISPYVNFKPMDIRAQNGLASYSFSTKSEDIDVVFDVHILTKDRYGKTVVDKKSSSVKISVRSERIVAQSKTKNGESAFIVNSVIEAGNANGILFNLKKISKNALVASDTSSYTLRVYDDISNVLVHDPINITKSEYLFRDTTLLSKSGIYRFEFINNDGIKGFTTITVLPALPTKIEVLPSSNTFIAGEKTTVLVRLVDSFGNLAQGEVYKVSGSISGGAGFIDPSNKEPTSTLSKNVIEGYASFDITNPKTSDAMDLSFRIDRVNIASESITLKSIDFAKILVEVTDKESIIVGKDAHAVKIKVVDRSNQILSGYTGILSLGFSKLSGSFNTPFVRIKNGVSETEINFTPGFVAEKNLHIHAQIPGVNAIEGDIITVLPDVPMSFTFSKQNDRMEAKEGDINNARATLYDRYGNIAYNATGKSLTLSIPEESKKYATTSGTSFPFVNGTLNFDIGSTNLPGKAYIIGAVSPGLESNSFTITDKSTKTLTITGVSKNVTSLDTYYVFNKSKLDRIRYDAQYTMLLGGDYGNVTEKEYLGGEILFNHDSKSLAVTTLLNNPWKEQELFGFTPAGKYSIIKEADETESLQTTIVDNGTKSYIAFYDAYRKEYIARAWLNIDPTSTSFLPCTSSGSDISSCEISAQTTVFMKGFNANVVLPTDGGLTLFSQNNIPLLKIDSNGKILQYPGIELKLDDTITSNLLGIKILSNTAQVGYLGIKFSSNSIDTVSSSELDSVLSSHKNGLLLETLSNRYVSRKTHLGVSSNGSKGITFAFRNTVNNEIGALDPAFMSKSGPSGLEDYPKKTGIGWEDTNRSLLEIAAGSTVGNATKFYQTFSTITLGDAVSHLPRVSTMSNYDRTIGTQIAMGNGEQIESYKKIDANGDGVSDIVIFYESGKIQLLINYSGSFKDMGYLAYVSDRGIGRKGVGNFFGDGYDDILLTDTKGKLVLLDNQEGKFTRNPLIILNESGVVDSIHGLVQQVEIFDMDADGKSDIVTVDDSGEINVLYGEVQKLNESQTRRIFRKYIIESGLGLRLSKGIRNDGGAFSYLGLKIPNHGTEALTQDSDPATLNQSMIDSMIYYQYNYKSENDFSKASIENKNTAIASSIGSSDVESQTTVSPEKIRSLIEETRLLAGPGNTDFTALDNSERPAQRVFIRSPFAEGKGLKVEKSYRLMTTEVRDTIKSTDKIRVEIILTNISTQPFSDAVYLDSNDRKIFLSDTTGIYTIAKNAEKEIERPLKYMTEGDFDYAFDFPTIAPGQSIKIQYLVSAIPVAFGNIQVGLLEKKEAGDDIYGDIALSPNNMCGGELTMWRSVQPYARTFEKGVKKLVDTAVLPDELAKNAIDLDKNGIPDHIDELIKSGKGDVSILQKYSADQLSKYNLDSNGNNIPDRGDSKGSKVVSYDPNSGNIQIGGLSSGNIDAINSGIDEVVKGLGCGFGGGGCINSPLNWAPLAPGSVPNLFGFPLGSMSPSTGLPVFSALTGLPLYGPWGCKSIPFVWPPMPFSTNGACSGELGAGGYLGTTSPLNVFRLFITPTISGAVGTAACFGGPVNIPGGQCAPLGVGTGVGCTPPPMASPLVPGGNCIVTAMPLSSCKDDGSDGDVGSLGLGMESGDNASVNANACVKKSKNNILLPEDRSRILSYVGGNKAYLPEINASMARGGLSSISSGPLIGVGTTGGGQSDFEATIDVDALKNLDFGNILKIKNTRVSAFPDFLMDWATRQLEEVINKLTSLPTLYIILPDFSGFDIAGYTDFPNKLSTAYGSGKINDTKNYAGSLNSSSSSSNAAVSGAKGQYNSLVTDNADTINSVGKNVSGIKAAYEFMSHLPLIKMDTELVDISIPWLSPEEMDKWLIDAKLTMKQWQKEFEDKQKKWSSLTNLSEADKKVMVQTEGLIGSLQENINIIEGYKKFPEKLQKYLTWKERYASQLLCNIEAIEFMMGGWISDNGKRFRTWVELYILIKAILKSWQLIIDLFYEYEAECPTCNNERYDLKHFMFKLISAIIPKIPIIQFPKWPDIWLDLHNIRGGLRILMPEYHFNFVPIIFPQLPRLYLPDVPNVNIGLPSLPILPSLPELPELPDLPSLPNIKLPDLPPPPTIPKLFGGIAAVLEIFKIVAKILCIMRINPFVPEWRVGDQIAQITERQGIMPGLDFLNVEFPNFSLSFVDAIKVTTFVNLEFDIDFIVAMSKATLDPLNKFTNDLSNLGSIVIPDINLRDTVPQNIDINLGKQGYAPAKKATKDETMAFLLRKLSFDVAHNFLALNLYIDKHSKEEVTVQGLKDILSENIQMIRSMNDPKALVIADTLQKAVTYSGNSEQEFIQNLMGQNTQKFRLIKDYIKSEEIEAIMLKTELDTVLRTGTMNKESTPTLFPVGADNVKAAAYSLDTNFANDTKQKILATNARILPSLDRIRNGGGKDAEVSEIQDMGNTLITDVSSHLTSFVQGEKRNDSIHESAYRDSTNKLLAINTGSPSISTESSSSTESSPSASTYKYEGIYILDKNNKQVRLFDYIDGVDGTEELISTDFDKDGDTDIIYRMNNSLYLKENFEKNIAMSHTSDSPKNFTAKDFLQLGNEASRILAAPNHFEETFATSNEINFSFRPANVLRDNLFRFEYYDYIDRFDRINSGENPFSIYPKTSIHKVDLIPDLSSETVFDTVHTGFVGRYNILSFGRGSGEATVTMNAYQYATPETNRTKPIIISAGRTIYTDRGGATISYIRDGETEVKDLSIDRNTNYEFLTNAKIFVITGKLYLFKESQEQRVLNVGDLYGMPILPGTKVELTGNSFLGFSYYDGTTMKLDGPATYQYYPLGKKAEEYSVSLPAPNDWYYANLLSLDKNKSSTVASLHLLSPQKQADTEGPLITYGDSMRVPVYYKQTLNLQSYLDDISGVKNIWVDMDLTKDTDGDGDGKNDKDSLDPSTPYGVRQGKVFSDIDIGPFDTLFTKKIQLFAEDGNGNTSSKSLTFTVYPPVPEIQSLSGSSISGKLNEVLGGEPIDVFRLRNGVLTRIQPEKTDTTNTTESGIFTLFKKDTSGIVLTQSGKNIANIDEQTGKITLEDTSFEIVVVPANKDSPLNIQILDTDKKVIFSEKIKIPSTSNINIVSGFDSPLGTGISVFPNTGFTFIKNTSSTPNLSDGGYITDTSHRAIAGISKTGDIYILNSEYRLSYTTKDSYVVIRLQDSSGKIVTSFLYKINAEYILK